MHINVGKQGGLPSNIRKLQHLAHMILIRKHGCSRWTMSLNVASTSRKGRIVKHSNVDRNFYHVPMYISRIVPGATHEPEKYRASKQSEVKP
jgi:hypothetical protein